jgi:hypothetical protein
VGAQTLSGRRAVPSLGCEEPLPLGGRGVGHALKLIGLAFNGRRKPGRALPHAGRETKVDQPPLTYHLQQIDDPAVWCLCVRSFLLHVSTALVDAIRSDRLLIWVRRLIWVARKPSSAALHAALRHLLDDDDQRRAVAGARRRASKILST